MAKKLKVLISAYACEPNKGSEPEVGWQWSMQMAWHHDVTVLTRTNNRPGIERELALLRGTRPLPEFVYHDEGPFRLWLKKRFKVVRLYYVLWQLSAWKVVERLQGEAPFDLLHHVTFAGFRYQTAIWNHGVPTVWGPVGGIESIPLRLLPWKHPSSLIPEVLRNLNNFIQAAPFHVLPKRAQTTTVTLVSTEEMEQTFLHLGLEAQLMPTIGLHISPMAPRPPRSPDEPLRILFVGNLITLKGIDLAIQALKESGSKARFTLVGEGSYGAAAKRLVEKLGLAGQVDFRGRLTRPETLKVYPEYDLFLFPSLHDTGGYAIIEAMACGLPVICLDCGGPRVAVKDGAGIRIPMGSRGQVIEGLAAALRRYDGDRKLLADHGLAAREVILRDYDWEKKGRQLNAIYLKAAAEKAEEKSDAKKVLPGTLRNLMNRLFPIKGLAISAAILFIIGMAGFLSVNHLKRNAELIVQDTLPGLSDAGAANSSLAEAFNRTLLLLMSENPVERVEYRKELDHFSKQTTQSLAVYERAVFAPEERDIYNQLLERRQKYLSTRQEVLGLMDQHRDAEALALCNRSMLPAYLEYKTVAEDLLKFDAQQGRMRGEIILRICTATQYGVAGIGVLLFVVGFMIGLFK